MQYEQGTTQVDDGGGSAGEDQDGQYNHHDPYADKWFKRGGGSSRVIGGGTGNVLGCHGFVAFGLGSGRTRNWCSTSIVFGRDTGKTCVLRTGICVTPQSVFLLLLVVVSSILWQ